MPRLSCHSIQWDTSKPDPDCPDPADLPEEVEITIDDDYDPFYEPAETLERQFGYPVLSLSSEEIE